MPKRERESQRYWNARNSLNWSQRRLEAETSGDLADEWLKGDAARRAEIERELARQIFDNRRSA